MKPGDLIEVFYVSHSGKTTILTTGLIIEFGNAESGEDLVFILKHDGEVEQYSRIFRQIKFKIINDK
tara:strand:- start:717 stop:917 length:201 start_codon:yes stop_codon:yes gene_type:complete